jgi:hypothetical protein
LFLAQSERLFHGWMTETGTLRLQIYRGNFPEPYESIFSL